MSKENHRIEREGINYIANIVETRMGAYFREIHKDDIGIDAIIEIKEPNSSVQYFFFAQIKSGESHIRSPSEIGFTFYPSKHNVNYWLKLPLPVLIIVYSPQRKKAYWQIFTKSTYNKKLLFDWKNEFNESSKKHLINYFKDSSSWNLFQKEMRGISDIELNIMAEKMKSISRICSIISDNYLNKRKTNKDNFILLVEGMKDIFDMKTLEINIINFGEKKYHNEYTFNSGTEKYTLNLYCLRIHLRKEIMAPILHGYSWEAFLFYLFGKKPGFELEFHPGRIKKNEINIVNDEPVYKVIINRPKFIYKKLLPVGIDRGNVKILTISDTFLIKAVKT